MLTGWSAVSFNPPVTNTHLVFLTLNQGPKLSVAVLVVT